MLGTDPTELSFKDVNKVGVGRGKGGGRRWQNH